MKTVYLETTIPSYLAAKPSGDLVTAAHQKITHDWWETRRNEYRLFVSDLVWNEIVAGDSDAATRRTAFLIGLESLPFSDEVRALSEAYRRRISLLAKHGADAAHIAVASFNRIDFVLTWNCRHIANEAVRRRVREINAEFKLLTPNICTPEELIDGDETLD
jgi:hypothetical protein